MSRRQYYDDYFSNGIVEIARKGKQVFMKSHLSPSDIRERNKFLSKSYEEKKNEIDILVSLIKEEISRCDPLRLLKCATDISMMQLIQIVSESQLTSSQTDNLRLIEYIQSVIVSQPERNIDQDDISKEELQMFKIFKEIEELYEKCRYFYYIWGARAVEQGMYTPDEVKYIVEAQLMSNVRGNRYQYFQLGDMRDLLTPHSTKIEEIYGVSADNLMKGLKKLEYALSSAKLDAFKSLGSKIDLIQKEYFDKNEVDAEKLFKDTFAHTEVSDLLAKCFGEELYNVKAITGWSDVLINSLSYKPGENKSFFNTEFPGWPFQDLPVQKKPFIKIGDISYCFDYYTLFDNIYRIIQKNIREHDEKYSPIWSKIQQKASEELVARKLRKILTGASVYVGNYYPRTRTSLKNMNENDIIAIYDDVVLIVEVKAGSFTYTPAITDFDAHKRSFSSLIYKADYQCSRTLKYIKEADEAIFYDNEKQEKFRISNEYKLYSICVTLDNFDVFEAKIEKTKLFEIADGTIAINLDDLDVYEEYFESPLCFLHYLKQRQSATRIHNLMLNDELDHLALYIEHNVYRLFINDYRDISTFATIGYREDLDAYYNGLHQVDMRTEKPVQIIPPYIRQMINYMEQKETKGRARFSEFLLDMSTEARKQFDTYIRDKIKREYELGYASPFWVEGYHSYCCFVVCPGVKEFPTRDRFLYAYANMLDRKKEECWKIDINVDNIGSIKELRYEIIKVSEFSKSGLTMEDIKEYSLFLKDNRKQQGIVLPTAKKRKIYPNESCPCGSGKKYKHCCGKK